MTNEFATNREPDEHIENMEEGIYASDQLIESIEGSTQYQFELNKLVKLFPFSPHCITPYSDDEPKEYTIDQLGLLSWEEEQDLRDGIETDWINAAIDGLIAKVISVLGEEVTEEQREVLYDTLRETTEETSAYRDYIEAQFEVDVTQTILEAETNRFRIPPGTVHRFIVDRVINLSGYQSVNLEGDWYIRDIADHSTEDTLQKMPRCKVVAPEPEPPTAPFRSFKRDFSLGVGVLTSLSYGSFRFKRINPTAS